LAKIEDTIEAPDPVALEKAKVLLIRHATTNFNVVHQQVVKDFGLESEEFRSLKNRRDLIDPDINEIGIT
jgi:hypothetical protein